MPDVDESGLRIRRYKTDRPWSKKELYYFIDYGRDLPTRTQDIVFYYALKYWADVSGLSFRQVGRAEHADIKIRWASVFLISKVELLWTINLTAKTIWGFRGHALSYIATSNK